MILAIILCAVFCCLFVISALDADSSALALTSFFGFAGSVMIITWLGIDNAVVITIVWMLLAVIIGTVTRKQ
jgi:hypothetical protein